MIFIRSDQAKYHHYLNKSVLFLNSRSLPIFLSPNLEMSIASVTVRNVRDLKAFVAKIDKTAVFEVPLALMVVNGCASNPNLCCASKHISTIKWSVAIGAEPIQSAAVAPARGSVAVSSASRRRAPKRRRIVIEQAVSAARPESVQPAAPLVISAADPVSQPVASVQPAQVARKQPRGRSRVRFAQPFVSVPAPKRRSTRSRTPVRSYVEAGADIDAESDPEYIPSDNSEMDDDHDDHDDHDHDREAKYDSDCDEKSDSREPEIGDSCGYELDPVGHILDVQEDPETIRREEQAMDAAQEAEGMRDFHTFLLRVNAGDPYSIDKRSKYFKSELKPLFDTFTDIGKGQRPQELKALITPGHYIEIQSMPVGRRATCFACGLPRMCFYTFTNKGVNPPINHKPLGCDCATRLNAYAFICREIWVSRNKLRAGIDIGTIYDHFKAGLETSINEVERAMDKYRHADDINMNP
jgi:hypothetical protein